MSCRAHLLQSFALIALEPRAVLSCAGCSLLELAREEEWTSSASLTSRVCPFGEAGDLVASNCRTSRHAPDPGELSYWTLTEAVGW